MSIDERLTYSEWLKKARDCGFVTIPVDTYDELKAAKLSEQPVRPCSIHGIKGYNKDVSTCSPDCRGRNFPDVKSEQPVECLEAWDIWWDSQENVADYGESLRAFKDGWQAALATKRESVGWKPITEYEHPPYMGYDPKVLLGWHGTTSNGRSEGVVYYGLGYWSERRETWINQSDNEPYFTQPSHFALICQHIPQNYTKIEDREGA